MPGAVHDIVQQFRSCKINKEDPNKEDPNPPRGVLTPHPSLPKIVVLRDLKDHRGHVFYRWVDDFGEA